MNQTVFMQFAMCLTYKTNLVNIIYRECIVKKKSFVEFADVFFVSDDEAIDLGNADPNVDTITKSNESFDLLENESQADGSKIVDWSIRDRKLQLIHLETTIKHLRTEILSEYEIFGLTTNSLGKIVKILELTNEWIPICSEDLNCINFAAYLVESNAHAQSLIVLGSNENFEHLIHKASQNQELADLWKDLQLERDQIVLLLKTESEHSPEQKEHIKDLVSKLDKRCEDSLSIFTNNEKLCDLLKALKSENLAFF